ncbi:MAG: hypothetical protein AAF383_09445 [Cyanobacteria bacterium P01_A01_bin.83]
MSLSRLFLNPEYPVLVVVAREREARIFLGKIISCDRYGQRFND